MAGQVCTLVLMYRFVRRWPVFTARPQRVREVVRFGIPLSSANILQLFLVNVGSVAVARGLGEAALGFYMLALNLPSWPLNIVGQAVRTVALPAFAQHGRAVAARLFGPAAAVTWAAGLPLAVLLAIFGHPLVEVMYGQVWAPAAAVLDGLGVYGALRVLFDLAVTYAVAHGATRSVLVAQLWWILALVPCIAVGVSRFGLAGAGWSQAFTAVVLVLPAYLWIVHRAGAPVGDLARRCGTSCRPCARATCAAPRGGCATLSPGSPKSSTQQGPPTIYYLVPDFPRPAGGIRAMYQHVDGLNSLGYTARVLHERPGFQCTWFANATPVTSTGQTVLGPQDVLVVSELQLDVVDRLARPGRVVNQSAHLTWAYDAGAVDRVKSRAGTGSRPDVVGIIVVSQHSGDYMRQAVPGMPCVRVRNAIDPAVFHPASDPVDRTTRCS